MKNENVKDFLLIYFNRMDDFFLFCCSECDVCVFFRHLHGEFDWLGIFRYLGLNPYVAYVYLVAYQELIDLG